MKLDLLDTFELIVLASINGTDEETEVGHMNRRSFASLIVNDVLMSAGTMISLGSVSTKLKNMERRGLLRSVVMRARRGKPSERRVYSPTQMGRREFAITMRVLNGLGI